MTICLEGADSSLLRTGEHARSLLQYGGNALHTFVLAHHLQMPSLQACQAPSTLGKMQVYIGYHMKDCGRKPLTAGRVLASMQGAAPRGGAASVSFPTMGRPQRTQQRFRTVISCMQEHQQMQVQQLRLQIRWQPG